MKLLKLILTNFQGIKNLELNFTNGQSASIYGDNATGKTTVFNSLTWLLFDKASTAAKNFTPKTKGPDGDLHHLEHSVTATFEAEDGRIVNLQKTYKEVYKKKRGSAIEEFSGHTVDYAVDGVPVKEKEYSEVILGFCGGDNEKSKMLTMPDYFSEQLSWENRRKILLEICGDISDEDIIASNRELDELPQFLQMPGTTDRFYRPDEYCKIASAKKSDINKRLSEIPGRIDEAERAIPDVDGLDESTIDSNINALKKKRDNLVEEKSAINNGGIATAELKRKISDLEVQISEKRAAHIEKENAMNATLDADILLLKREATAAKHEKEDAQEESLRLENKVCSLTRLRKQLIDDYSKVSEQQWDERQAACPTCHQNLPADQVEKMREEFNLNKSKKLEEINQRGKNEASKEKIAELEYQVKALTEKMTASDEKIIEKGKRVKELETQRVATVSFEDTEEYKVLTAQIAEYEAIISDERKCASEAVKGIEEQIKATDEAIQEEQNKKSKLVSAETQHKRIAELENQERKLNAEYENVEKGLFLCDLFIKAKVSMLTDRINQKFKNVRFRLFQDQLNGGVKEDCEVMIPTADGRMVPYTFANNAARINAGLEIINTLAEYWGIRMPVFIDNAESVTHLTESDTQTIRLVVSEADKKLRLEVGSNG